MSFFLMLVVWLAVNAGYIVVADIISTQLKNKGKSNPIGHTLVGLIGLFMLNVTFFFLT